MMSRATLSLVLLVSCAHGLVHVFELSLPSVEQEIADEYFQDDVAAGKQMTGRLSNYWRLLWGLGALVAGWLVDSFGGRRMLAIYLLGCAAACIGAAMSSSQPTLFVAMIVMGAMASIYHPAGLALISHDTNALNRPKALGIHGIFGSIGIGSAPLLAWLIVQTGGMTWRHYYWVLAVPAFLLGLYFVWAGARTQDNPSTPIAPKTDAEPDGFAWQLFFTLTVLALMQGFVYSAMMSFLPRYLSDWQISASYGATADVGKILAAVVLLVGCGGQYLAGRYARPAILEWQLTWVTFANAPCLFWMAVASGWDRALAAGLFALVHFMHQPIYNSLIAKYTPRRRRSLCYGFSFAMGLGFGSFGARFAGNYQSDFLIYGTLAAVAFAAGCVGLTLCWLNSRTNGDEANSGTESTDRA